MKILKKSVFLIFFICTIYGQIIQSGKVVLKDKGYSPLADVAVCIKNLPCVKTDSAGKFTIEFCINQIGNQILVDSIFKEGFELLNFKALNYWNISADSEDEFTIVMRRKSKNEMKKDNFQTSIEDNLGIVNYSDPKLLESHKNLKEVEDNLKKLIIEYDKKLIIENTESRKEIRINGLEEYEKEDVEEVIHLSESEDNIFKNIIDNFIEWYKRENKNVFSEDERMELAFFIGESIKIRESLSNNSNSAIDSIKIGNEINLNILISRTKRQIRNFYPDEDNYEYKYAIDEDSTNFDNILNKSSFLHNKKRFIQAEKWLLRALDLNVNALEYIAFIFNSYGDLNHLRRDNSKARNYYIISLSKFGMLTEKDFAFYQPLVLWELDKLKDLEREQGYIPDRHDQLTESLEILLEMENNNRGYHQPAIARVLNQIGTFQVKKEKFKEAEESYLSSIELYRKLAEKYKNVYENTIAEVFSNLSNCCIIQNKYKAGIEYAKISIIYNPSNYLLYTNLAIAYILDGQFNKAKAIYEKIGDETMQTGYYFDCELMKEIKKLEALGIKHPDLDKLLFNCTYQ